MLFVARDKSRVENEAISDPERVGDFELYFRIVRRKRGFQIGKGAVYVFETHSFELERPSHCLASGSIRAVISHCQSQHHARGRNKSIVARTRFQELIVKLERESRAGRGQSI